MYHLWGVLLKYWFIRILGCLSTVLIRGREHRQDSEKPIGNLFSCLHRCPQTQQTFEISILWWFHAWYRLCKQGSRFPHQKGIYSLLTQLQLSLLWSHFLQRKNNVVSDNWILLLVFLHQIHPQNIISCLLLWSETAPFLRLLYKTQMLPALLPSSTLNLLPTLPLCDEFHSSSNNLFILLSAMSWFPFKLCPLPSHNISPNLTLMPWQEVSAHTWCLYFPKEVSCTEITQTGCVNKITIRKNDVAEGLERDSNLRKKHRFGWGNWGVTIKQNKRVLGQHRKRAPEVSPRHHPFTHLYLNSIYYFYLFIFSKLNLERHWDCKKQSALMWSKPTKLTKQSSLSLLCCFPALWHGVTTLRFSFYLCEIKLSSQYEFISFGVLCVIKLFMKVKYYVYCTNKDTWNRKALGRLVLSTCLPYPKQLYNFHQIQDGRNDWDSQMGEDTYWGQTWEEKVPGPSWNGNREDVWKGEAQRRF